MEITDGLLLKERAAVGLMHMIVQDYKQEGIKTDVIEVALGLLRCALTEEQKANLMNLIRERAARWN